MTTMPSDPQAVLAAIKKRDADWANATEWGDHLVEHPETECSADRDRQVLLSALAESEKRVRVLEAALTRCAEYGHAQADLGSKHHERFIDDWRDCPARSCVAARAVLSEPETPR